MTTEEFQKIYDDYNPILSPIITQMINDNFKFCQIDEKIKWSFGFDDNIRIMGTHDKKSNEIHMNILSCIHAHKMGHLFEIEYFIIHEMRHIFQNNIIKRYIAHEKTGVDVEIIEKWIYEQDHYKSAVSSNGEENPEYFKQDIEFDAYAFSYAVMKYNNKEVKKLWVPSLYMNEWKKYFQETVDYWTNIFEKDNL